MASPYPCSSSTRKQASSRLLPPMAQQLPSSLVEASPPSAPSSSSWRPSPAFSLPAQAAEDPISHGAAPSCCSHHPSPRATTGAQQHANSLFNASRRPHRLRPWPLLPLPSRGPARQPRAARTRHPASSPTGARG
ncbi:hypothetical protein U9M48_001934 [Paspalum notatum var. saurae]|uniref:Uncharacterized protein n=1 Tax=Paspalum notatum var. saurae TaxID=547442 RepID=A0AAQ3SH28_PASNO